MTPHGVSLSLWHHADAYEAVLRHLGEPPVEWSADAIPEEGTTDE